MIENIRLGKEFTLRDKLMLVVKLSIPSILAQITSTLMFFIDAAMVGKLGAEASAAIGIVETSTWLIFGLSTAIAMGFSVQVAHFIGANDIKQAREVFRQGIMVVSALSLLLSLVCIAIAPFLPYWLGGTDEIASDSSWYFGIFGGGVPLFMLGKLCSSMLKCSGNIRIPSIMNILTCILDVIFNYLFIYIIGWGVPGAAVGSVVAYLITMSIESWYATIHSKEMHLTEEPWNFKINTTYLKQAMMIAFPMILQYLLMDGAQILSTIIVAPLGVVAIATNNLAITAESLCYMPGYGISEAATTVVGQSIGAGRYKLTRSFSNITMMFGMLVMTIMGIIMYITAPLLMGLLTPVQEIIDLGSEVLRIEAWAEPMFAAAIVGNAILLGAGDTVRPAIINLSTMWGVRITLAAILANSYGLKGVWFAMATELSIRGLIFIFKVKSPIKKKLLAEKKCQ